MPAVLIVTTHDRAEDAARCLPGRRVFSSADVAEAAMGVNPAVLVVFQGLPPGGLDLVEEARAQGVPVVWAYMDAIPRG